MILYIYYIGDTVYIYIYSIGDTVYIYYIGGTIRNENLQVLAIDKQTNPRSEQDSL